MASARKDATTFERSVAAVLQETSRGEVVTYGEVAAEAGYPGAARAVGTFLARSDDRVPWWRVVTSTGRLVPGHEAEHAQRLRLEGVAVSAGKVRPQSGSMKSAKKPATAPSTASPS